MVFCIVLLMQFCINQRKKIMILSNIEIGQFLIQEHSELGISVFVRYESGLIFCDNFDNNLESAKQFIKRQSKYKIKVVDGEFYAK